MESFELYRVLEINAKCITLPLIPNAGYVTYAHAWTIGSISGRDWNLDRIERDREGGRGGEKGRRQIDQYDNLPINCV